MRCTNPILHGDGLIILRKTTRFWRRCFTLAKRQMRSGFGGMISVVLKGDIETAKAMLSRCKVFTLAESLGGIESLIELPAIMTYASIPKDVREKTGIADSLIRLSVGIENLEDLKADLDQAMGAA